MMSRAVTILALAFFLATAFQSFQLLREYSNLEGAVAAQQPSYEQAIQISEETEGFAGEVAVLADKGNANAKQVIEQMRQQGINMRAPQVPPAPTP
jgi:glutaminase